MTEITVEPNVKSLKDIANRIWQVVLPLGGEFAGSHVELTPLSDNGLTSSVADVLANPPSFPKLKP